MNRQKCDHCGFVNGRSDKTCRRCTKHLGPKWDPIDLNWKRPKEKRSLSFVPSVLVMVIAGLVFAVWQFRPEAEQPEPHAANNAVNSAPAEKPIVYAVTEPANAGQQSNGIRSTFKNSKIINEANKRVEEMNRVMGAPRPATAKK